jgi:hypothetical protein
MGFIEEMFDPDFLFDNERKQRADIQSLTHAVASTASPHELRALQVRVNQLQLLCNALTKMLEMKGIVTETELAVLVQQTDLLDGREDSRQSEGTWHDAPRCAHCNHFVNPSRHECIYCGRTIQTADTRNGPYRDGPPSAEKKVAPRSATCSKCKNVVPQNDTMFTEDGELWCSSCLRRQEERAER